MYSLVVIDIFNLQPVGPTTIIQIRFDHTFLCAGRFDDLSVSNVDTDMPLNQTASPGVSGMVSMVPDTVAE